MDRIGPDGQPNGVCSRRSVLQALAIAAAGDALRAATAPPHRDTIRLDVEHQVIDNFGASDCWSMQKVGTWSPDNRIRIADLLFSETKGIGLSCWRFNIGGGINPKISEPWRSWRTAETFEIAEGQYDWTRQAGQRWFLTAARERGVPQFLAFVNSPPGRMTRNGLTFCGRRGTTNLKPGFEARYARYLVDILEHFRTDAIPFDYISPINEPQWGAGHSQEGMRASNADIKGIVKSLAAELARRNCPTQLAILESGCLPDMSHFNKTSTTRWGAPYGNYLEEFLGDPSISPLLSGRIGYHAYGSDPVDGPLVNNRRELAESMKKYPGWKIWQTEYCILVGSDRKGGDHRDLTMKTALDVARVIHLDLAVVGASAWQWWTAVSPVDYKDGLIYTDWKKPGDPESILPARLLWALGNYSRFVRPGMRRVQLDGPGHDIRGLMGSAWKDEKARQVVLAYVNMAATPQMVQLRFEPGSHQWQLQSVTPWVTSDKPGDELKAYPAVAPDRPLEVPARSVTTLVARFA
ncbi:MAG: glycoside hydrolase [Bryobacteraceae bacterium]|jgi:O-glycosyl hydrolase